MLAYHPASREFYTRCALWLDNLQWEDIDIKAKLALEIAKRHFDYEMIGNRFANFVQEILEV